MALSQERWIYWARLYNTRFQAGCVAKRMEEDWWIYGWIARVSGNYPDAPRSLWRTVCVIICGITDLGVDFVKRFGV